MLTQDNLVLTRIQPDGWGGTEFLYRVEDYGLTVVNRPQEDISQIHWEVDVIKYKDTGTLNFEVCHATELAHKTLKFFNDKSLNEFLQKAFAYFKELNTLEGMLSKES